ncbi:methyltransferase domain-containing protein [Streptomyces sp. SAJ15]|uniref:methyltransferase domain-containing protein n=1 Tax=Streptomyces sp. SAJ15 TaxID=2011095 RepID=UPI0011861DCC|nr:methyltransferase domain-containing protein [Streptomyces sp. SAJ15]TVL93310.1 protein-L-isoaspartate(D-aspartate) O-methyltransferase [Streptomyces sp. SAJ15]
MDWKAPAERLATQVTAPTSRWREIVATTPRHLFVPRWWESTADGAWALRDGPTDESEWLRAAYSDTSLVTRVGPHHADDAQLDDRPTGRPTSSSTMTGLVVRMLRHGLLYDGADLGLIGTGTGASTALAARRLGDRRVTALDVDPYLTDTAAARLASLGLFPKLVTCDATEAGGFPGDFDRIVALVALPNLAGVLAALRPGGRLVTTLARMNVIITADKDADGTARGVVEWDRAGFMSTRAGSDYPPDAGASLSAVRDREGEVVSEGRYPVLNVSNAWDVGAMLELTAPGVEAHYEEHGERRTTWLVHADGSWARASATWLQPPTVHQGGPRRLWTVLERIRHRLNAEGTLPIYGSHVRITPDGRIHFTRGKWSATFG